MNHIHLPAGEHDQGWINRNVGWVRAVYAEIDRWNQMPHAQQIRCGLLYRWIGDAWSLYDKKEILTDFRQALRSDYRWRAAPDALSFSSGGSGLGRGQGGGIRFRPLEERFLVQADDFTALAGVGEKTQIALRAAGIMIFEQLAELSPAELDEILAETGLRTLHIETWPAQAALAAAGRWDELDDYRARLASN
jgi:hypothetical protein